MKAGIVMPSMQCFFRAKTLWDTRSYIASNLSSLYESAIFP